MVKFDNQVAPIPEDDLPKDLNDAHFVVAMLFKGSIAILRSIRNLEPEVWVPDVVRLANIIGPHLKEFHSRNGAVSPAILLEFAGLGMRLEDFRFQAPSRHEWVLVFAEKVFEEIWIGMYLTPETGRTPEGTPAPSRVYFSGHSKHPFPATLLVHEAVRIKEHMASLELPDERLVNSNLKSEVAMLAANRTKRSPVGRVHFDDDSRQVRIDGVGFSILDDTAYLFFKAIAAARPQRITSLSVAEATGLRGKKMARELKKLPETLFKMIDTQTNGHLFTLPPEKLS